MRHGKKYLFILAYVLTVSAVAGQGQGDTRVYGRVHDLWGRPLSSAVVKFYRIDQSGKQSYLSNESLVQISITDDQGNYDVNGMLPGLYKVSVELRGFRRTEIASLKLQHKASHLLEVGLELGQLTDIPSMEIYGVVEQSSKTPIQNATVRVVNSFNPQIMRQTRTDKMGNYRLTLPAPGQYIIYASKPEFGVQATAILSEHSKAVDFTLIPLQLRQIVQR